MTLSQALELRPGQPVEIAAKLPPPAPEPAPSLFGVDFPGSILSIKETKRQEKSEAEQCCSPAGRSRRFTLGRSGAQRRLPLGAFPRAARAAAKPGGSSRFAEAGGSLRFGLASARVALRAQKCHRRLEKQAAARELPRALLEAESPGQQSAAAAFSAGSAGAGGKPFPGENPLRPLWRNAYAFCASREERKYQFAPYR